MERILRAAGVIFFGLYRVFDAGFAAAQEAKTAARLPIGIIDRSHLHGAQFSRPVLTGMVHYNQVQGLTPRGREGDQSVTGWMQERHR